MHHMDTMLVYFLAYQKDPFQYEDCCKLVYTVEAAAGPLEDAADKLEDLTVDHTMLEGHYQCVGRNVLVPLEIAMHTWVVIQARVASCAVDAEMWPYS